MMKKAGILFLAMSMVVCCLAGCNGGNSGTAGSEKIKWYLPIGTNADNKAVFEQASAMVKEKLNATLDIVPLEFGNYEAKMQVLNAAAETFDIMFTSNWANNYYNNVSKGILLPLNDYLENDVPKLYESIPDYMWKATMVNGKIYAVPNQQIAARSPFLYVPKHNADVLELDLTGHENISDYHEFLDLIEEYLKKAHASSNTAVSLHDFWNGTTTIFGMEEVAGSGLPGVICYNSDEPTKVVNQYESEAFQEYLKWRRALVLDGILPQDIVEERYVNTETENAIARLGLGATYKPGIEAELFASDKYETAIYATIEPLMTSGSIIATMNGVSKTSKKPQLAMRLIELLNTDKELYNLISFGIEDVNWRKTGDNRIEKIADRPYECSNWAVGSVYNSYLLPQQADDVWQDTKRINDTAKRSPLLGFSPNLDAVQIQIAGCKTVVDEYRKVLDYAVVDIDTVYPEFVQKLKAAGADQIVAELQRQIDEWTAAQ